MTGWLNWLQTYNGAVIALATVAGVLVATVYSFFTRRLWHETRRQASLTQGLWTATEAQAHLTQGLLEAAREQASITRSMFEASHRPYVSIDPDWGPSVPPRHFRVNFMLQNHGTVPAIVTRFRAVLRLGETTMGEVDTGIADISLCIFPGKNVYGKPLELAEEPAIRVWESSRPPTIDVTVHYRAPHGQTYMTQVVARLVRAGYPVPDQHSVVTERHEVT